MLKDLSMKKSASESIEEHGNNRCKHFRYIGEDNDPLADLRNAKIVNDLKQYWRFCQDSAGFFPASWLEFFFKDCKDLLDINKKRQKAIVKATNFDFANNYPLLCFITKEGEIVFLSEGYRIGSGDSLLKVIHQLESRSK